VAQAEIEMARSGGKGKISNDLVAVSCAAVLSVYSAGYWRTRDAARRFETQAEQRRPARPEPAVAIEAKPAEIQTAAPTQTSPESRSTTSPPVVAPAPATSVAQAPSNNAAAPDALPQVASPQATLSPVVESRAVAEAAVASAVAADTVPSPLPPPVAAPGGNWRDGTYTGWGTSRHGEIKAQVVIRNGRIVESSVASCETRWPCDVITEIFNQPVERQSADVDRVSRATESSNAYYYALVAALDNALPQQISAPTSTR
jgi:uncharacterized protein with FMN-binding domain